MEMEDLIKVVTVVAVVVIASHKVTVIETPNFLVTKAIRVIDQMTELKRKANLMGRDLMTKTEEEAVKDKIEKEASKEETQMTKFVFQKTKKRLKRFLISN